ncbi:MAG TPA: PilZ domain-containing protein [Tepidisphaeraceae bacterium]|nr:PilZ domain-containing protein [Tepidisphaeraceae bacterium]
MSAQPRPASEFRTSLRLAQNGENRRRSDRTPFAIWAFLSSPSAGPDEHPVEVTAMNLSRHGIAFDLDRPLPVGGIHVIEVGMGAQRLVSECRIISCRAAEGRVWNLGAEFC